MASCLKLLLFLSVGLLALLRCTTGNLVPNSVAVVEGEGFMLRLNRSSDATLQNCQLTRNNKLYILAPGLNTAHRLATGEEVRPFDYNNTLECGIRVFNASLLSSGSWKLTSIDENGKEMSGTSSVSAMKRQLDKCPQTSEWNCMAMDWITGERAKCGDFSFRANRTFACSFHAKGNMEQQVIKHLKNPPQTVLPTAITELGSTVMQCGEGDFNEEVLHCTIKHSNSGRQFFIQEGLQHQRYSAYKSDFKRGICQFEIPTEGQQEDAGLWVMTVEVKQRSRRDYYYDYTYKQFTRTCKFRLKGDEKLALERIRNRTNDVLVIKTTQNSTTIVCADIVHYPIEVCYITIEGEDDVIFNSNKQKMADGSCRFEASAGNYTCGFNGPTEDSEDFEQRLQVIKYEREIIDEAVHVDNGTVTLECHLIDETPVKICLLLSPSGKVYRPTNDSFKSKTFSYFGGRNGGSMETGDCGIKITQESTVESGEWKCVIVKENEERLTTGIFYQGDK